MSETHFANEEIEREHSASEGDEYPHDVSVIDINSVVSDIRATLQSLGPPLSRECCIYRVPNDLRRVNEVAYTPQMVSIGPLHHGKKTLEIMEKYKLRYLDQFLKRTEKSTSLKKFVKTIKRWESSIRSCYAETFDHLHSDKFVKMILVDAAFIFEYFLWDYYLDLSSFDSSSTSLSDDYVFYKIRLHNDIGKDLILLENQLPFFVLEGLCNLAFPSMPNYFHKLTLGYFSFYNRQKKSIPESVKHFTDLLRYFQLPLELPILQLPLQLPILQLPSPQTHSNNYHKQNDKSIQQKVKYFIDWLRSFLPHCCRHKIRGQAKLKSIIIDHLYTATELHDAGVKFKVSSSNCLLDIEFNNGVLTIPCLELYDTTESYIRNIIALEQYHYPFETYICEYVSIMDRLVNTTKDVDLLAQNKIIDNHLGDQEPVAALFNKLGTHILLVKDSRYKSLCKDLNEHYEVRCNKWKAILRNEYFSTPWRIASIIAAFILLVLTLTQTICAIISL